jgi:hypothetical protein
MKPLAFASGYSVSKIPGALENAFFDKPRHFHTLTRLCNGLYYSQEQWKTKPSKIREQAYANPRVKQTPGRSDIEAIVLFRHNANRQVSMERQNAESQFLSTLRASVS